jgi:hypothetical protein
MMSLPDYFLKQAEDCERSAKFARDRASKATWSRMAERWRRCATTFGNSEAARNPAPKREQKTAA